MEEAGLGHALIVMLFKSVIKRAGGEQFADRPTLVIVATKRSAQNEISRDFGGL